MKLIYKSNPIKHQIIVFLVLSIVFLLLLTPDLLSNLSPIEIIRAVERILPIFIIFAPIVIVSFLIAVRKVYISEDKLFFKKGFFKLKGYYIKDVREIKRFSGRGSWSVIFNNSVEIKINFFGEDRKFDKDDTIKAIQKQYFELTKKEFKVD